MGGDGASWLLDVTTAYARVLDSCCSADMLATRWNLETRPVAPKKAPSAPPPRVSTCFRVRELSLPAGGRTSGAALGWSRAAAHHLSTSRPQRRRREARWVALRATQPPYRRLARPAAARARAVVAREAGVFDVEVPDIDVRDRNSPPQDPLEVRASSRRLGSIATSCIKRGPARPAARRTTLTNALGVGI